MKSTVFWALVGLNVLLLAGLLVQSIRPNTAVAQVRRPGEYAMIPAEVVGGTTGVVYVLDTTNGVLSAMSYDEGRRLLNVIAPIELARVFEAGVIQEDDGDRRGRPRRR